MSAPPSSGTAPSNWFARVTAAWCGFLQRYPALVWPLGIGWIVFIEVLMNVCTIHTQFNNLQHRARQSAAAQTTAPGERLNGDAPQRAGIVATSADEMVPEPNIVLDFGAEPVVRIFLRFLLRVVQGIGLFVLILGPVYSAPVSLLIKSTFKDDVSPQPKEGAWLPLVRQVLDWLTYHSNLLSLASIRRFVYIAWNPVISEVVVEQRKQRRYSPFHLGPDRVTTKVRLYIETALFTPHIEAGPKKISRTEYGELVAQRYVANVRAHDLGETPVLQCSTCFDIFGKNGDRIAAYLDALEELNLDPTLLCRIQFDTGYLAPTYLVSGLLDEFDEDWTRIVRAYADKIDRNRTHDPLCGDDLIELRKLQVFIWDCWVQWGPSVPVSYSDPWREGLVGLQFGYGDENNSIPVLLSTPPNESQITGKSVIDIWGERLARLKGRFQPHLQSHLAWAWPVKMSGYLRRVTPEQRVVQICPAQRDWSSADDREGWLVLDASSMKPDDDGPLSYSAYVWVMIAICEARPSARGECVPADRGPAATSFQMIGREPDDEWRFLIPFFQHGNIAEASVFRSIKKELAGKTVDTLLEQLRTAHRAGVDWLHFAFVAAFDDNGDCGRSPLLELPPGDSIATLLQRELQHRRRILADLRNPTPDDTRDLELLQRVHAESDAWPALTANDLPRIVRNYLDHVQERAETESA